MANSFLTLVPAAELKMVFLGLVGYLSRSNDIHDGLRRPPSRAAAATYVSFGTQEFGAKKKTSSKVPVLLLAISVEDAARRKASHPWRQSPAVRGRNR